jgi:transposase
MAYRRLAADKKGAGRKLAAIVLLDESGFMLQPVRRRTWAPAGQTPIHKTWDRHDRISAIGAMSVTPRRHRLSFYFHLVRQNLETHEMVWFLTELHRHFRRKVILVWDRWSVHRSAAEHFGEYHPQWFDFEWLPGYAPELNPVEPCWDHTKYADLPNFIPDDVNHLQGAVAESMERLRLDQRLLKSCFDYAKLPL